jgi:hypothetical protein
VWIEAGLDPASFYTYTLREVSEIVAAKAKRDLNIFRRDAEMQNVLMHSLALKIRKAYHEPNDFPEYKPLDFGGDQPDGSDNEGDDVATIAKLRRYFTELKDLRK